MPKIITCLFCVALLISITYAERNRPGLQDLLNKIENKRTITNEKLKDVKNINTLLSSESAIKVMAKLKRVTTDLSNTEKQVMQQFCQDIIARGERCSDAREEFKASIPGICLHAQRETSQKLDKLEMFVACVNKPKYKYEQHINYVNAALKELDETERSFNISSENSHLTDKDLSILLQWENFNVRRTLEQIDSSLVELGTLSSTFSDYLIACSNNYPVYEITADLFMHPEVRACMKSFLVDLSSVTSRGISSFKHV